MKQRAYMLLGALLLAIIAVLGWDSYQQRQQVAKFQHHLEMKWANDLSGLFSYLADLPQDVKSFTESDEIARHELQRIRDRSSRNSGIIRRQLSEMERFGYDTPAVPLYLAAYLDEIYLSLHQWSYLNRHEPLVLSISAAQAAELHRHAQVAEQLTRVIPEHYPGWNRGFPTELQFWEQFRGDPRWRAVLADMDQIAEDAGYWPRR